MNVKYKKSSLNFISKPIVSKKVYKETLLKVGTTITCSIKILKYMLGNIHEKSEITSASRVFR